MTPVEAAVEAGARAWFDHNQAVRRDSGRKDSNGQPWRWEHLTESDQRGYLALARTLVVPALAAIGVTP